MGFAEANITCLRKVFSFTERASRSEFWWSAPIWFVCSAAIYFQLSPLANTKDQSIGAFYLLIALCFPAITAASRRSVDAGLDQRWVGWSFGITFFGFGLITLATGPLGSIAKSWMKPTGTIFAAIGVLLIIILLTRATIPGPSEYEEPQ